MVIPTHPKLEGFDILQTPYKTVQGHEIRVDILIPRNIHAGKRPTIVRFHGGGLVMGDSFYMHWWPHWVSDLALKHGAIIISPNYRLMPSATSAQIYEDIEDFWKWLHSPALVNLLAAHSKPTEADLGRIITTGDSAGGLLSIYVALAHSDDIRATTASYPWVDPGAESFSTPRAEKPFGAHTPEEVLDSTRIDSVESSITSDDRIAYMLASVEHGRLGHIYARGSELVSREILYPMALLEKDTVRIPRGGLAVIQGFHDSIVPQSDVAKFMERLREVTMGQPGNEGIILTIKDGEHGFDWDVRLSEQWLQETLRQAIHAWLQ